MVTQLKPTETTDRDVLDQFARQLLKQAGTNLVYVLEDTNNLHYNCGHYAEWKVSAVPANQVHPFNVFRIIGMMNRRTKQDVFLQQAEAERVCKARNAASQQAWHDFLND